jgi:hypothetical protein
MIEIIGGPDRDRTDDLFHAMEARSQLRHRPTRAVGTTFLFSPLGFDSSNRTGRTRCSNSAHDHLQAGIESRVVVEE